VARHADRPHSIDYISALVENFMPMAGDKLFGEDEAIIGGLGFFKGQAVMIIGQEKGHDLESRMRHGFGMAKPEGYRKAKRLMETANHFNLPIISLVDTAGAFPGIEGEERGQAEAIASCILEGFKLEVPYISVVIGEGGSGGAIAIATANRILMLEHSIYSVISPEGCASILWRDGTAVKKAATALKLTAQDLYKLGVVDEIIAEPAGGAHRFRSETIEKAGNVIWKHLQELQKMSRDELSKDRENKFLAMSRLTKEGM
jgi:acetyl-CoA carboxylase carboxyl transferase subunit alpha